MDPVKGIEIWGDLVHLWYPGEIVRGSGKNFRNCPGEIVRNYPGVTDLKFSKLVNLYIRMVIGTLFPTGFFKEANLPLLV